MHRLTNKIPACFFIVFVFFFIGSTYSARAQCITFPPGQICAGDACNTGPTTFTYTGAIAPGPGITYKWDFGDPNVTTDTLTTTLPTASFSYAQPGNYTVQVIASVNGVDQAPCSSNPVTVEGFGEFTIGPTDENLGPQEEEFCIDDVIPPLVAVFQNGNAPANPDYLWSGPGVTEATKRLPSISITKEGCYSLEIKANGCTRINKLNVRLYKPDPTKPAPPQDQARWYFGNNGGIRFPGGQPTAVSDRTINAPEGSSSVLNSKGQLLFYTDGITVYDSLGNPMPDIDGNPVTTPREIDTPPGEGLNGGKNSTQAVTIVPQPGCNDCQSVYYVFTTSDITTTANGSQLSYSVVDMRQNNSLGQVLQKNVPLFSSSTERVISIQGNPTDPNAPATTWIVTHDFKTNNFRVYPLTPQGVGSPVSSDIGSNHGPETIKGEGYMKASADGTKLAVLIPGTNGGNNVVEIFDFDSATGEVSNPVVMSLGTAPPIAYGLEFSGDEMYVSLSGNATNPSQLVRYNLSSSDSLLIALSKDTIATSNQPFGALQMGPDQKIYLAIQGSNSLGVVNNPNGSDLAGINFLANGFALKGGTSGLGLPNNSPSESQSYGQDFSFNGPLCAAVNESVNYTFRAQPDRAGGDPTKSWYEWLVTNKTTGAIIASYPNTNTPGKNDSITVSLPGPGTYEAFLTIFNDCIPEGEVIPAKTITILQSPNPVALGPNRSVCTGTAVTLDAYTNATGPAGALYFWTQPDGATVQAGENFTITSPVSGNYQATVIVGECVETGTVNVNFSGPQPNFLGNDTTLCQPTTLVLNAGIPGSTYQWSTGATTQTITVSPTATTTYSVTVTDPLTKCVATDQIVVTIGAPPVVTATSTPATGCVGDPINADGTITLTVPAGSFSYVWTKAGTQIATTKDITGQEPGIYQVIVTNTVTGCSTTLSKEINSTASTLNFGAPTITNATCTVETGSIQLNLVSGTPTSYQWFDANNNPLQNGGQIQGVTTATLTAPAGTYSVEVSGAGCQFFQTAVIQAPNDKPVVNPRAIDSGCQQKTLLAGAIGDYIYQWSRGGTNITTNQTDGSAIATQSGSYTIRVSKRTDLSCFTEETITITIPLAPPAINITDPTPVCEGTPVVLNASSPDWTTYLWTAPNGTTFSGSQLVLSRATESGKYTISVRNAAGCTSQDEVNIVINPIPAAPTASNPTSVCAGGSIPTLTATGTAVRWYSDPNLSTQIPPNLVTQVGNDFSFLPNIDRNVPGVHTFYATQTTGSGCQSPAKAVSLEIKPSPVVNLPDRLTICIDDSTLLDVTNQGATYLWSNTLTTPTIRPTRSGVYSVTVTIGTCSVTDQVEVTILPSVKTSVPRREVPLCLEDPRIKPVTLDAGPGTGFTYFWPQLNKSERTVEVSQPGVYEVLITDEASGCTKTEKITVTEKCEPRIAVPEAFTPNQDSDNPELEVFGLAYVTDFEMQVFNRWGEVVFATKTTDGNQAEFWDGTYLGKPAPLGSYAWKISFKSRDFPERETTVLRGGVLLIR